MRLKTSVKYTLYVDLHEGMLYTAYKHGIPWHGGCLNKLKCGGHPSSHPKN